MEEVMLEQDLENFMSNTFPDHKLARIRQLTLKFNNADGQINVLSCLAAAVKANKLDKALSALEAKFTHIWKFEHPDIRGMKYPPFAEVYEALELPRYK